MIDINCNKDCLDKRNYVSIQLAEIVTAEEILEKENEEKREKAISVLQSVSQTMTELAQVPQAIRESQNPSTVKAQSNAKVQKAWKKGLINTDQKNQMLKEIDGAFSFGPLWTTSYKEIVDNVKKGNYIYLPLLIAAKTFYLANLKV